MTTTEGTPTPQRVSKVITAVLHSPNRSVQRAALWMRLQDLRNKLITTNVDAHT